MNTSDLGKTKPVRFNALVQSASVSKGVFKVLLCGNQELEFSSDVLLEHKVMPEKGDMLIIGILSGVVAEVILVPGVTRQMHSRKYNSKDDESLHLLSYNPEKMPELLKTAEQRIDEIAETYVTEKTTKQRLALYKSLPVLLQIRTEIFRQYCDEIYEYELNVAQIAAKFLKFYKRELRYRNYSDFQEARCQELFGDCVNEEAAIHKGFLLGKALLEDREGGILINSREDCLTKLHFAKVLQLEGEKIPTTFIDKIVLD